MTQHPSDQDATLSAEEQEMFEQLPREFTAPPDLERRLVHALARRQLLTPTTSAGRPWFRHVTRLGLAAVASFVLLLGGMRLERATTAKSVDQATYALLLYEGEGFQAETDANYPERYAHYSDWIAGLRAADQFVTGLVFDSAGGVMTPGALLRDRMVDTRDGSVASMFLVSAASYGDAVDIARSMPHISYGGSVAIRRIVPVRIPQQEGPE